MNKFIYKWARLIHRYAGYMMIIAMTCYAVSGTILLYRKDNFLKYDEHIVTTIEPNLSSDDVGRKLKIRISSQSTWSDNILHFNQGTYDRNTGKADYTIKRYPRWIEALHDLHMNHGQYMISRIISTLFGFSLFFFALSSLVMFPPKSKIFKRGMWFMIVGVGLAMLAMFF